MQNSNQPQTGMPRDVLDLVTLCWVVILILNIFRYTDFVQMILAGIATVLTFLSARGRKPIQNQQVRIIFWLIAVGVLIVLGYLSSWQL